MLELSVEFLDGSFNINLPSVNQAGNQNTSGNAATATALENARTIGGFLRWYWKYQLTWCKRSR